MLYAFPFFFSFFFFNLLLCSMSAVFPCSNDGLVWWFDGVGFTARAFGFYHDLSTWVLRSSLGAERSGTELQLNNRRGFLCSGPATTSSSTCKVTVASMFSCTELRVWTRRSGACESIMCLSIASLGVPPPTPGRTWGIWPPRFIYNYPGVGNLTTRWVTGVGHIDQRQSALWSPRVSGGAVSSVSGWGLKIHLTPPPPHHHHGRGQIHTNSRDQGGGVPWGMQFIGALWPQALTY